MSQKFKSDIEAQAGIRDSSGAIGTSGQVLSSTGSNVSWINQTTIASDVQNQVKAGVAINKGQAVYVTGADGTNIIVGLASNTSEATSSKTLGLLNATVTINGFADVVQIGRLAGLNTIGANAGDPVWLGTNGNLIYGLINKPYAPAHLVFLGIVTRVNANNGEIFVNVQNGFELNEIHDVDLKTNVPINGDILGFNGTLWVNKTIAQWLGYTPANASGTTNYVSKFTGATTLGNSLIYDNGTNIGIGTTGPGYKLQVVGVVGIGQNTNGTATIDAYGGNAYFGCDGTQIAVNGISGNVGIGTTSPISKLHINNTSTAATNFLAGNNNGGTYFGWDSDNTGLISTYTNAPIKFGGSYASSFNEWMRITSSGNVGIGTTTPLITATGRGNLTVNGSNDAILTLGNAGVYSGYLYADSTRVELSSNTQPIAFVTSGNERIRIASNGAIKFNSYGSGTFTGTATQRLAVDSLGNVIEIPIGGGAVDGSGTTNYVTKWTDADTIGNSVMYDNGTNVGIGTTSPSTKLEVYGTDNSGDRTNPYNVLTVTADNPSLPYNGFGGAMLFKNRAYTSGIVNSSRVRSQINNNSVDSSGGSLHFDVTPTVGGSLTEAMMINYNGNVGIGTTSPSGKFEIDASGGFNWGFPSTAVAKIGTKGTGGSLLVSTPSLNSSYESGFAVDGSYSSGKSVINLTAFGVLSGGPYGADIAFRTTSQSSLSEKMRITSDGNVGIGTTSPDYKLDVAGNGRFSSDLLTTGRFGTGSTNVNSRVFASAFSGELAAAIFTTFNSAQSTQEAARFSTSDLLTGAVRIYPRVGAFNYNIITVADSAAIINQPTKPLLVGVQDGSAIQFTETDIRIGTNNSEKMRITSGGNVGIGTSSPNFSSSGRTVLDINGTSNTMLCLSVGGTAGSYLYQAGGNLNISNEVSGNIISFTGGSERMRITSTGIVQVSSGDIFGGNLASDYGSLTLRGGYGATTGSASKVEIRGYEGGGGTQGAIISYTNGTERMRIMQSGNVGIGTTSPASLLDISGASPVLTITRTGGSFTNTINFNSSASNFASIISNSGTGEQRYSIGPASGWGGFHTFYTDTTERMRITSSGNVGIGLTSPNPSALLHLKSTTQGFLPPVMKTGERDNIGSPAVGLMIFNKDDEVIQVYTGDGWRTLAWA